MEILTELQALWKWGHRHIRQGRGSNMSIFRTTFLLQVLLLCSVLISCESEFDIAVVNGLDSQISDSIGNHTEVIPSGKFMRYHYPSVDGTEESTLQIATFGCTLWYRMTHELLADYHWRSELRGVLPVELKPDFKLYALQPGTLG